MEKSVEGGRKEKMMRSKEVKMDRKEDIRLLRK